MKLPTKLVAVRKISSTVARSSFPAEKIEKTADLIIQVEGIINPIVLRRTSLESYEVVDGHFEYYAAVRAREISLLKGEMIQAIILEPENEEALLKQLDLLRKGSNSPVLDGTNKNSDLESKFANLEQIFQSQFDELRKDNRSLERSLSEVKGKVENSSFEEELIDKIVTEVVKAITPPPPPPVNLNLASKKKLKTVKNIGEKTALRIIERRETKGKFTSVEQLLEIEGITENKMDKNRWRECFVIKEPSI